MFAEGKRGHKPDGTFPNGLRCEAYHAVESGIPDLESLRIAAIEAYEDLLDAERELAAATARYAMWKKLQRHSKEDYAHVAKRRSYLVAALGVTETVSPQNRCVLEFHEVVQQQFQKAEIEKIEAEAAVRVCRDEHSSARNEYKTALAQPPRPTGLSNEVIAAVASLKGATFKDNAVAATEV